MEMAGRPCQRDTDTFVLDLKTKVSRATRTINHRVSVLTRKQKK